MANRLHLRLFSAVVAACLLQLMIAGTAGAQPFPCTGEAFVVQNLAAQLFQIDQSVPTFVFDPIDDTAPTNGLCDPGEGCNLERPSGTPIEVNNLGFRSSNGLLYAAEVDLTAGTNAGIISVDSAGTVTLVGATTPALPPTTGFNAGDVSEDGTFMYLNLSGQNTLYCVDLTTLALGSVAVTGPGSTGSTNVVLDWAYNPSDGMLYGADRTGQVVRLSPGPTGDCTGAGAGLRTDLTTIGLAGGDFGGSWFNASGQLFLFDNAGTIYEVDLSGTPTVVGSQSGPLSSRNDSAACIQDVVGAAKEMTTSNGMSFPTTITIVYNFENFSTTDSLTLVSADDDLAAVFGTHGSDWTFTSITSSTGTFHNAGYNGHSDTELINQAPPQVLAASSTVSITVSFTLLTGNAAISDMYCNQIRVTGDLAGLLFGDLSTDGTDPDPSGDDLPDENDLSCITQTPVELQEFSIE